MRLRLAKRLKNEGIFSWLYCRIFEHRVVLHRIKINAGFGPLV